LKSEKVAGSAASRIFSSKAAAKRVLAGKFELRTRICGKAKGGSANGRAIAEIVLVGGVKLGVSSEIGTKP
jgi:hypothetical protein